MDTRIVIIAAASQNGAIGKGGELPWKLKDDLKRFAKLTRNHTVICGRKTHESILKRLGHPLVGRKTIVITRQKNYAVPKTCSIATSWENAVEKVREEEEVFVIGGSEIFRLALPHAHELLLTRVDAYIDGDVFFPEIDWPQWDFVSRESCSPRNEENEFDSSFWIYRKKPHCINRSPYVYLENAREAEQLEAMKRIQNRGECPFCLENLRKEHKEPLLSEGKYWVLTRNQWKYDEAQLHLLLISTAHTRDLSDLPVEAGQELFNILQWAEKEFGATSGGVALRFGDARYNGATVEHLHVHFIVPFQNIESTDYKPVRFKIGAKKPRIG